MALGQFEVSVAAVDQRGVRVQISLLRSRFVEPHIWHGIVLAVECPEMEAGRYGGRGDEGVGDLHSVRLPVSCEVRARSSSRCCIEHYLPARFEERLRDRLLSRSNAGVDLGPRDGCAIRGHASALERECRLDHHVVPAENLDDDIGIVEDAG